MARQLTLLDYISFPNDTSMDDVMVVRVEVRKECLNVFVMHGLRYEVIGKKRGGLLVLRVYMPRSLRHELWIEYGKCMLGEKE